MNLNLASLFIPDFTKTFHRIITTHCPQNFLIPLLNKYWIIDLHASRHNLYLCNLFPNKYTNISMVMNWLYNKIVPIKSSNVFILNKNFLNQKMNSIFLKYQNYGL